MTVINVHTHILSLDWLEQLGERLPAALDGVGHGVGDHIDQSPMIFPLAVVTHGARGLPVSIRPADNSVPIIKARAAGRSHPRRGFRRRPGAA